MLSLFKYGENKNALTTDRCKSSMKVDFKTDTLVCQNCGKHYIETDQGLLYRYDLEDEK